MDKRPRQLPPAAIKQLKNGLAGLGIALDLLLVPALMIIINGLAEYAFAVFAFRIVQLAVQVIILDMYWKRHARVATRRQAGFAHMIQIIYGLAMLLVGAVCFTFSLTASLSVLAVTYYVFVAGAHFGFAHIIRYEASNVNRY